ncbi:phosphatase PAP2 family protein [Cellvibrio sp. KY-GH-1]|uniref:phosphatase PAP2 family protein n=1 Tax=Cellvibrio sp. KY-GH-1 TaxID=2303332 RepID=UPI001CDA3C7E|nr:phosphatase PAP2 family protein [Cellvibrio sp. KY-GH-1]
MQDKTAMQETASASTNRLMLAIHWLWQRELPVLLAIFATFVSLFLFVLLTQLALQEQPHELDRYLLLLMRNPHDLSDPLGPPWLEEVGRDITALGGNAVLILLTLAVLIFLLMSDKSYLALVVLVATLGALGASSLLKKSIDRDRPDLVPHRTVIYTASFPSGHSMLSASTYLTLGALLAATQRRKRIKIFILLFCTFITLLVGISRVYLGVHWPSDVVAGWTAGAAWALICWLLARGLQRANNRDHA